ncbi:YadA C-terminal domain-containing protein, partial [Anaerospora sp.]|uniref:YadA C-terminal domain-containing protein n=1 Tax=Anaerospora sp. TaxID=1960278 RepID=UPI00289E1B7C
VGAAAVSVGAAAVSVDAAADSKASAASAATSEANAKTSENNAGNSANQAASSATSAKGSSDEAKKSEVLAKSYADQSKIDYNNLSSRVDKVGALASAFSALAPMDYDANEPTQLSVGIGNYGGETAFAAGVYHYVKNDVLLNAAISICGSETAGRVGATWKIGHSSSAKASTAKTSNTAAITSNSSTPLLTAPQSDVNPAVAEAAPVSKEITSPVASVDDSAA